MEAEKEPIQASETEDKPRSFPKPILTAEQWEQVRRACEAGLEFREAAEVFKTSYDAIKQRACREKWLTPLRIEKERQALAVATLSPEAGLQVKRPETALQAIAETFESHRSQTLLGLAKLAGKGIQKAIDANLEIENWQDAKIAADIAMKLHNVGQESVQVNIAQAFAGMDEGPLVSIDEVNDEDSTDTNENTLYFTDNE